MYINRVTLLVIGLIVVFLPSIDDWVFHSPTAWYRPYQFWLAIIAVAWWNQHSRDTDEL